jgi:hypothetical protein
MKIIANVSAQEIELQKFTRVYEILSIQKPGTTKSVAVYAGIILSVAPP